MIVWWHAWPCLQDREEELEPVITAIDCREAATGADLGVHLIDIIAFSGNPHCLNSQSSSPFQ